MCEIPYLYVLRQHYCPLICILCNSMLCPFSQKTKTGEVKKLNNKNISCMMMAVEYSHTGPFFQGDLKCTFLSINQLIWGTVCEYEYNVLAKYNCGIFWLLYSSAHLGITFTLLLLKNNVFFPVFNFYSQSIF